MSASGILGGSNPASIGSGGAGSLLSSAGPAATPGPKIAGGTGPGGTPTTALSVYHLITQLCQRPDPTAAATASNKDPNNPEDSNSNKEQANSLPGSNAQREHALLELSKKREQYEDLALVLWHSFGEWLSRRKLLLGIECMLHPCGAPESGQRGECNWKKSWSSQRKGALLRFTLDESEQNSSV